MRLLISSITNAPPEVLSPHLETVLWQQLPPEWSCDIAYIVDPEASQETRDALDAAGIEWTEAGPKPDGSRHSVSEVTHDWSIPTFHWLAREKQAILDAAVASGYDAVALIDSDLLLSPRTILSMLAAEKPVVSAVFWTRWTPEQPLLPQVWLQHPYGLQGRGMTTGEFIGRLQARELVQVGGLGACTLIRSEVLDHIGYWPLVPGLPSEGMWQGEDRHFSVRAQQERVELWADAWPEIFHVYRPSDVSKIPLAMEALAATGADLVSATIEPLEEPALPRYVRYIRGNPYQLQLLKELRNNLVEMAPGDERVISLPFPPHWPVYAGESRIFRLRLLDAYAAAATTALQELR